MSNATSVKSADAICADPTQGGKSEQEKLIAVRLYSHGLSFRAIAKFFRVNVRSFFVWVKKFAEKNYSKPEPVSDSVVIELDGNVALFEF